MTTNDADDITDGLVAVPGLSEDFELSCASEARVLITGDTGLPKDAIAQAIHRRSPRSAHPFVAVHCAGVPEADLEAELFGPRAAGRTDDQNPAAALELANHGTVFLNEVGQLPERLQFQLAQFLESAAFRSGDPAGSNGPANVRIIAATSDDLWEAVSSGRFRVDLYYRLNVIHIIAHKR